MSQKDFDQLVNEFNAINARNVKESNGCCKERKTQFGPHKVHLITVIEVLYCENFDEESCQANRRREYWSLDGNMLASSDTT